MRPIGAGEFVTLSTNDKLVLARAVSAESKQKESERVLKEKLIEFEVIERYWKTTEGELRKQIAEMQHDKFQTEQLLSTAETVKHSATESSNSYKSVNHTS